jgi:hypothetical protein
VSGHAFYCGELLERLRAVVVGEKHEGVFV